jgi:hypothetical protein
MMDLGALQKALEAKIHKVATSIAEFDVELIRPIDQLHTSPWSIEIGFKTHQDLGKYLDDALDKGVLAPLGMDLPEGATVDEEAILYTVQTYDRDSKALR